MLRAENIPEKLKALPRWVCWKSRPKGNGKTDKIPYDPRTNSNIDHLNPRNQLTYKDCLKLYDQHQDRVTGIGYVFMPEDPFSGVDLDDCLQGESLLAPQQAIVQKLNSFSEISPSGRGVKIFVEGKLPGPNKNTPSIEMYSHSRFFTVTGNILNGNSSLVQPRQKELELVYFQYFPEEHPQFGEFFPRCYLMRFLLEKSRSGVNLSHSLRRALASFSIALDDLDSKDMPFITLMLSGCLDFNLEKTRKQVESLVKGKSKAAWGCGALQKVVREHFSDFDSSQCDCQLQAKEGRKPSPIRFVAPAFVEIEETSEEPERLAPLPSFPLDVFPEVHQKLVQESAEAFRVPVEIPACNLLSLTGACIGRSRRILVTPTWYQYANLWLVIVGRSGIGKSPCMDYLQGPVRVVQKKWFDDYTDALLEFDEQMEIRKKASREERGEIPRPEKPKRKQLFVDDVTSEALVGIFDANPRGILWIRDEISGLLLDLDKYSGQQGSTKARLMSAYDSGAWAVDRVGRSSYVPHAFLSMFGGIQPKYVSTIFSELDADTGFLPRFLFVVVNRTKPAVFTGVSVSEMSVTALNNLIHGLLDLRFDDHGNPVSVMLNPEAHETYLAWHDRGAVNSFWNDPDFESVMNKLQGQCLRIALNLYYMDIISKREPEVLSLQRDVMLRAIRLTEFFMTHQKRIWDHMTAQKEILGLPSLAQQVLKAILVLEDKIEKGKLATRLITKYLNQGAYDRCQVSPDSVGKMAKPLGLKTGKMPGGRERGYVISSEDLERLKELDTLDAWDTSFKGGRWRKNESAPPTLVESCVPSVPSGQETEKKKTALQIQEKINAKNVNAAELNQFVLENGITKLFIDTETTGLDPHSDELALIQVMAGDQVFFLDPDQDLRPLLEDEKILKVFHNAKFDLQFLRSDCKNIFDTYLTERLLTAGITPLRELGLQNLAKKYLDIELDKSLRTSFSPGQELTPEQVQYAALDVKVLEPIFRAQKKKLKGQGLVKTALLEFSIIAATAKIELNGTLVDLDKLEVLKTTLTSRIAYLEEELRNQVKDLELSDQKELFDNGINFRSPDQVKRVLQALGFEVESTGIKALKKIDHPFAKTLVKHRKASKLLSSFVEALPPHINQHTGRIHPEFHQLGTDTGRYTCSKPNLQQIPKEQEWRDLFVAAPGHKIITADYSQIELRILAEFSQDETFLEAYRTEKDLHQETANQIGISRDAAKAINFGICYGMSSAGLAERLNISSNEAQSFISAYFRAYPRVKATLDQLGLEAVSSGYSETPLGRKRYFKPVDSFGAQKSLERKGRNTPIQATCGDILKSAVRNLMKYPDIKIINLVHDEIVFEVEEDKAELDLIETIREAMTKAGKEFLKTVPVEVDITVDNVWRK
jgi:DNA polymerase-1